MAKIVGAELRVRVALALVQKVGGGDFPLHPEVLLVHVGKIRVRLDVDLVEGDLLLSLIRPLQNDPVQHPECDFRREGDRSTSSHPHDQCVEGAVNEEERRHESNDKELRDEEQQGKTDVPPSLLLVLE